MSSIITLNMNQLKRALSQNKFYQLLQKVKCTLKAFRPRNLRFISNIPSGHFYSPIPDYKLISDNHEKLFDRSADTIPSIDLNKSYQLSLVEEFSNFSADLPFSSDSKPSPRFTFDNSYFGNGDAVMLYSFLRYFKPENIIEIGSGHSSALMLDINDRYFESKLNFTFIEPYPQRLLNLLSDRDRENCDIISKPVQNLPLDIYDKLKENDILFVDSSHVVKIGSDLHYIIKKVLPAIKPGVIVHFHDIFWPFEYPEDWLKKGWAWNEAYFLMSFLQYNQYFEILMFGSYLEKHHHQLLKEKLPFSLQVRTSTATHCNSSLWLRRCK